MTPESVTLQEHLEAQIEALKVQVCAWIEAHDEKHRLERRIHDAERDDSRRALELQARENERRFGILNNEAGQLKAMQATYIPREIHTASVADVARRLEGNVRNDEFALFKNQVYVQLDKIGAEIDRLRIAEANLNGRFAAYAVAIGLAVTAITFILNKVL